MAHKKPFVIWGTNKGSKGSDDKLTASEKERKRRSDRLAKTRSGRKFMERVEAL